AMALVAPPAAAPPGPEGPPGRPHALLMTVALGPASALDGTRAFADVVWPGASGLVSDFLVDEALAELGPVPPLDAFEATAPRYILVVDVGGVVGAALVGKIGDPTDLAARAI